MKKKIYILFLFIFILGLTSCNEENNITNPESNNSEEQKGWFSQQSGTSTSLTDVYFISDATGWAIGYGGVIVRTSNGGSNWLTVTSGTTTYLTSLHFINSLTGWVCGDKGVIIKTTDGGISWVQQAESPYRTLYSIFFISEKMGWTCGSIGDLMTTTNGGTEWKIVSGLPITTLYSVHFINEMRGRICGEYIYINSYDGGVTWYVQSNNSQYLNWVYFTNEMTGWLVNGVNLSKSTDGGVTWFNLAASNTNINKFNAPSIDTLYGCSASGEIIKSINGGTNWIMPDKFISRELRSIYFINNKTGWVVGQDGVILKTTTGGS